MQVILLHAKRVQVSCIRLHEGYALRPRLLEGSDMWWSKAVGNRCKIWIIRRWRYKFWVYCKGVLQCHNLDSTKMGLQFRIYALSCILREEVFVPNIVMNDFSKAKAVCGGVNGREVPSLVGAILRGLYADQKLTEQASRNALRCLQRRH